MNKWIRIGIAILLLVILLRVGFAILGLAMRLVSLFFPILILIGAGFVVYGIIRHLQRRALRHRSEYPPLED